MQRGQAAGRSFGGEMEEAQGVPFPMSRLLRKAPPPNFCCTPPILPRSKRALRADDKKCVKEGSSSERAPGGRTGKGLGMERVGWGCAETPPPPGDVPTGSWMKSDQHGRAGRL